MRVLVCGDRNWDVRIPIIAVLDFYNQTNKNHFTLIEGCAPGADRIAHEYAGVFFTHHEHYPAEWGKWGRAAGPIRNQQMLDEGKPDVVWAFHDDLSKSRGTADMVRRAKAAGVPVYVVSRA